MRAFKTGLGKYYCLVPEIADSDIDSIHAAFRVYGFFDGFVVGTFNKSPFGSIDLTGEMACEKLCSDQIIDSFELESQGIEELSDCNLEIADVREQQTLSRRSEPVISFKVQIQAYSAELYIYQINDQ